ncbi:MAG: hypothetical protein FWG92_02575 [Leptospirales bacterium]|nr:hypothetical protein [Leptospirales bacterium]
MPTFCQAEKTNLNSLATTGLFANASSLFALTSGTFILYPEAGFGASSALCSTWNGDRLGDEVAGDPRAYKDITVIYVSIFWLPALL